MVSATVRSAGPQRDVQANVLRIGADSRRAVANSELAPIRSTRNAVRDAVRLGEPLAHDIARQPPAFDRRGAGIADAGLGVKTRIETDGNLEPFRARAAAGLRHLERGRGRLPRYSRR